MRAAPSGRRGSVPALATAGLALVLPFVAGCGGSDDRAAGSPTPVPTSSAPAPTGSAAASPAENHEDADCVMYGGSAVEFVKQVSPAVTAVEVKSCAKAVVTMSVGADPSGDALRICQVAANAAHDHGVALTSVVTTEGKELASGTAAVDCKLTS